MTNHLLLSAIITTIFFTGTATSAATYNVKKLGAKPDGKTDSTKPFTDAWSRACGSNKPATVYVPKGTFMVGGLRFSGPCKNSDVTVRIDGTLVAPENYFVLGKARYWLRFQHVHGVTIVGGTVDARGAGLWACKSSRSKNCPDGATSLAISNSNNVKVYGLTSVNSQMFHIVVNGCKNVRVVGVNVVAPADSPNTDGIHVQLSTGVTILDSKISTGDDCVSIGPGATDLWVENVACGPGHGISIGSLGKDYNEQGVKNVTVKRNAIMTNVENPILIDQNYCPGHKNCPNQVSGVRISNVKYQDVHGTSATKVAVRFDCSKKYPCKRITMQDVNLSFKNKVPASAYCVNAGGKTSGVMKPTSCF
ncbi:hypothetical protein SSX86_012880 [Deinandra increscens subsp. villosa]|uniref:Uncharacterized protein n=1 Tax=Deinandra increscens subsp. villosa TaxID=3103831 RepID=A0AAP0D5G3_9ASTR